MQCIKKTPLKGVNINLMGRLMGIEPTNAGATIRCVNHFATIAMAGVVGIEPTSKVLETSILPLNYTPKMEGGRFELPNPKERIYSPPRLATSLPLQKHPFKISDSSIIK